MMVDSSSNVPTSEPPADPPRKEAEYLERESRLAREALERLRGEALESLERSADLEAWAARYPWQILGAAAVAGVGAGWAMGKAISGGPSASEAAPAAGGQSAESATGAESTATGAQPTSRLVSGLGTLAGVFASAAVGAATEAVTKVIKESIHDTLRPEDPGEPIADDSSDSP